MQFSVKSFFVSVNSETRDTDNQRDNELSFFRLYKRHVHPLFNYGMHACNDHELVKDCLQELFIRARDQREARGVNGSVKANLFKIFRELLIQKVSVRRGHPTIFENTFESLFELIPGAENLATERHGYVMEEKGTTQLSRRQQEAIFLKFYGEFSYSEIAAIMDLKVESVYNLVSKAVENLHHRMKETVPS